jgi:hypothetical protein
MNCNTSQTFSNSPWPGVMAVYGTNEIFLAVVAAAAVSLKGSRHLLRGHDGSRIGRVFPVSRENRRFPSNLSRPNLQGTLLLQALRTEWLITVTRGRFTSLIRARRSRKAWLDPAHPRDQRQPFSIFQCRTDDDRAISSGRNNCHGSRGNGGTSSELNR